MAETIKYICITCHKEFEGRRCPSCGINANKCISASGQSAPEIPVTQKKEKKSMNVGRMVTNITSSESVIHAEKDKKQETSLHGEEKADVQMPKNTAAESQNQNLQKTEGKKSAASSHNLDALLVTTSQKKQKQQVMSVGRISSTTANAKTEKNRDATDRNPQEEEVEGALSPDPIPEKRENTPDPPKTAPVEDTSESATLSFPNDPENQADTAEHIGSEDHRTEKEKKRNTESQEDILSQGLSPEDIQDGSATEKQDASVPESIEYRPYQQPDNAPQNPQTVSREKKGTPVSVAWEKREEQKPVTIRQDTGASKKKNTKPGSNKKRTHVEIRKDDNGNKRIAIMKKKAKAEKVDVGINFNEDDFYSDTFMFEELPPMSFRGAVIKVALTIVGIIASAIFLLNYFW